MMRLLANLSLLAGASYIYVGYSAYKIDKKSRLCRIFLVLNILMSVWAIAYSFIYTTTSMDMFFLLNKIAAFGWCTFSAVILYLILVFIDSKFIKHWYGKIIVLFPAPVFLSLVFILFGTNKTTSLFVSSLFTLGNNIYNFLYLVTSLLLLFIWGHHSKSKREKKQSQIIVRWGIFTFLLNFLTHNILPYFGIIWLRNTGQITALFLLFSVYYVIIRYQFLGISSNTIRKELFLQTHDMILFVDYDGIIRDASRQICKMLGIDSQEVIGQPITTFFQGEEFVEEFEKSKANSLSMVLESVDIRYKDGTPIPMHISIAPITDSETKLLLGILVVGQDNRNKMKLETEIESHRSTNEKLKISRELFRTMVEIMPFSVLLTNRAENTIIYTNSKAEEMFYIPDKDMINMQAVEIYENPKDREYIIEQINKGIPVKDREVIYKKANGEVFIGQANMVPTIYDNLEVLLTCIADVTKERTLQREISHSRELLEKLLASIPDIVFVTDLKGIITYFNQSVYTILGYGSEDEIEHTKMNNFFPKEEHGKLAEYTSLILDNHVSHVRTLETKNIAKNGKLIDVEINGTLLYDDHNKPYGTIYIVRDICERKESERELQESNEKIEKMNNTLREMNKILTNKSVRDGLTNLLNHQRINEILEDEISKTKQNHQELCVMMMDLDFFKKVNDTYGHLIGDYVLQVLAELISKNIRDTDFAGRYGGEEFIVVLPDVTIEKAYEIGERIRKMVENYQFSEKDLKITISIGIAQRMDEDAKELIGLADALLYKAKANGRNRTETGIKDWNQR